MSDSTRDGDAGSDPNTPNAGDGDARSADVVPPHRAVKRSGRLDSNERQGTPYTESQVIMPTVKIVAPFAFTYGLFVTFHGGGSPGGGFQGGAIMAAVVFMIAFAFGIESTRTWLANTVVVALAVGGALAFAGIGLVPVALGGAFLQYDLLPIPIKYGLEAVEIIGIAPLVAGVLMGLFFLLANGFALGGDGFEPDDPADATDDGREDSRTGDDGSGSSSAIADGGCEPNGGDA
ncbi:MnhB domain-containing protein [Halorubrum laminariae]|uniref:MnhB domain-containing protein n=1 Tax=Halorubrum laminariae TaxID=1433523 RepID=A0ABD6C130_9EURY|nr:MnhB domain-containing protein [Halorubrum laminariae]